MPLVMPITLKSSPISEGLIKRCTALVALSLDSVAVGSPAETSTASPSGPACAHGAHLSIAARHRDYVTYR